MQNLNTFLNSFKLAGEPFFIRGDRLYTLELSNGFCNSEQFLSLMERKYPLERSVDISNLEYTSFLKQKNSILNFMEKHIRNNFISKLESSEKKVIRASGLYEQNRLSSIERFIREKIIPEYAEVAKRFLDDKSIKTPNLIKKVSKVKAESFDVNSFVWPGIEDLKSDISRLDKIIEKEGVLIVGGRCYSASRSKSKSLSDYVKAGSSFYSLDYMCCVDELDKIYKQELVKFFQDTSNKQGNILVPLIKQNNQKLSNLTDAVNKSVDQKFGNIGYKCVSEHKYQIFLKFNPFIIKKDDQYYKFPELKLGTDLIIKNNMLEIVAAPQVLGSKPYLHPFVWSDKRICYSGDTKRWHFIGIDFGKKYPINSEQNQNDVAWKVALALSEGFKVIHKGYIGNKIIPVNNLHSSCKSRKISYSEISPSKLKVYNND
ncbi:hypothetical protein HOK51_02125 [Candidatus Woesearchaeota archaeon]|nr:hypothetical protein [Candidatus Woesearchaeota archaeon]MBT6518613.1 hypothetical protein [Candidatus Woesearchaeota archaeon]MBT7368747.1 hypothetical protein [Candidatus Woesearchaeota archaeon]